MSDQKVRIGFVGCGDISDAYLKISKKFEILETVAVADIDRARAKAKAKEFDVPVVCGTQSHIGVPSSDWFGALRAFNLILSTTASRSLRQNPSQKQAHQKTQ